ncbi:MAG: hypothetical protein ABI696_18940 [Rubrivivax sp.]
MTHPLASTLHTALASAIVLTTLAGCGKSDPPVAPAAAARAPAARLVADSGAASAEEVARQARGGLSCPPKLTTPARAAAAPVDDVQGVRPGLGHDEAMNAVLCTNELLVSRVDRGRGFTLKAAGARDVRQGFGARFAEPRVVKTSKQIMQEMQNDAIARGGNAVREDLKPGQVKWSVGTMGVPGQETVLSVAREERFAADQRPTVETVTAALLKKYGTPTQNQGATSGQLALLRWAYDPLGRRISETSPLYHRCNGTSDPDGGVNLSPDCGIVVQAMLIPQRDNAALVDRLQVGVVDQAGGFRLITATEQALGQQDQQRRATEVEKAAKNTKAPTL